MSLNAVLQLAINVVLNIQYMPEKPKNIPCAYGVHMA